MSLQLTQNSDSRSQSESSAEASAEESAKSTDCVSIQESIRVNYKVWDSRFSSLFRDENYKF